jgi:integrase
MGLGPFPEVSLAEARNRAREARSQVRDGVAPIDAKRAAKSSQSARRLASRTFAQVAEAYITSQTPGWKSAKHAGQWLSTLQTYAFPLIGGMLLDDITTAHVRQVLEPIWSTKHETARRVRGRIESVISYGDKEAERERLNPARWSGHLEMLLAPSKKVAKRSHHAALPYRQVPKFMERLRAVDGQSARALEFAILCAARSGEVRGVTWSEIDLEAGEWVVPGDRMKSGRPHRVPLSGAAVALLSRQSADDDLLFPGAGGRSLSDMALNQVCRRLQVSAVPHGFRSSFRTWAGETTSFPHEVIEAALAHTVGDATVAAYMRGDLFEKRRKLMAAWGSYCAHAPTAANVSQIGTKNLRSG